MVPILLHGHLQTDISRSSGPAVGGTKKINSDDLLVPEGFVFLNDLLESLEISWNLLKCMFGEHSRSYFFLKFLFTAVDEGRFSLNPSWAIVRDPNRSGPDLR